MISFLTNTHIHAHTLTHMHAHTLTNAHACTHTRTHTHTVHCGSTRQTASIVAMNRDHLRTGDKATCHFRFIKTPEYIKPGTRMVFREGRTKAVGNVTKITPYIPGTSSQLGKQKSAIHHHTHHQHHHHHHQVGDVNLPC